MPKLNLDRAKVAAFLRGDNMVDETALKAAADLAEILEDVVGRPLTAEERARCHLHVHMFKGAIAASDDDNTR